MTTANQFHPDYATSPGETLRDLLEDRAMSQGDLAVRTGLTRKTINEIVAGKAPLTPEMAQKLELVFNVRANFWNERERLYRQQLAFKAQEEMLRGHLGWQRNFPYAELVARGKLAATANPLRRIRNLCCFFGIAEPASVENVFSNLTIAGTLFRRGAGAGAKPYLAWTWLRLAELQAAEVEVPAFEKTGFAHVAEAIAGRTAAVADGHGLRRFVEETITACRAAGVGLLLVPELKGAAINGAAFWHGDTPVIALTLRGKRLDGFVFTLLHEAAHILRHRRNRSFVDVEDGAAGEVDRAVEEEANEFAARRCVPPQLNERIGQAVSLGDIDALAREAGVHRDLVIGRYGRLTNDYRRFETRKLRLDWEG